MPRMGCELTTLDMLDAERAFHLLNLVLGKVDGPTKGRACATPAIVAITYAAANWIALDFHRALATGTSGYAHFGLLPTVNGLRHQQSLAGHIDGPQATPKKSFRS